MPILAVRSSNRLSKIDKYAQWDRHTDIATTRLNGPQGQKNYHNGDAMVKLDLDMRSLTFCGKLDKLSRQI